MADSSKMKLQVQNNSWNVKWLIAKLIAVEGSHLLPVSKISKNLENDYCNKLFSNFTTNIMLMVGKIC